MTEQVDIGHAFHRKPGVYWLEIALGVVFAIEGLLGLLDGVVGPALIDTGLGLCFLGFGLQGRVAAISRGDLRWANWLHVPGFALLAAGLLWRFFG